MKHFFKPLPNQILYHYTSAEGAAAILSSNAFRLSEFSMMNDKSEYQYSKSKFIAAYRRRNVWVEEVPRLMANIKLVTHEPATVMMIGCLTKTRDDVGLWERYANYGKGCVLGIDANWLAERAGVAIRNVVYDPTYIKKFVNSDLAMLQNQYEEDPTDRRELEDLVKFIVLDLYAFKDPRFKSEREVRVSRLTVSDEKAEFGLADPGGTTTDGFPTKVLPILQRQGAYGPTRFIELPLWDQDEKSAIRFLGLGPRIDADSEKLERNPISLDRILRRRSSWRTPLV